MKDKKCILLVRVSTEAQSYDEQEKELYDLALRNGYDKDQIVPIAEKESGIKLSEEERRGLNRMKELIATGEYDCVFAWEISRIARTKKVLFSILDYLYEKKIQLIIKEPELKILNSDGSINEGAETVFTLYSQLAEIEMRNKRSRFERARKEFYAKGKYMGGFFLFGYKIDENGFWVINEEEAAIVRMIFDMYISGEYNALEIAAEVRARGYLPGVKNLTNAKATIHRIIRNESYIGKRALVYRHTTEKKNVNGIIVNKYPSKLVENNNIYPAIIDMETWEKCVERRKKRNYKTKEQAKYLLTPLIHCSCGASYCANSIDGTYQCRVKHNAIEKGLTHTPGISVNMIESLAWFITLQELAKDIAQEKSNSKEEYEKEIAELNQKKAVSEQNIDNMVKRRSSLDEAFFVQGRLTQERYDALTKQQNETIDEERENIRKYDSKIRSLNMLISAETTFDDLINSVDKSFEELRGGTDLDTMRRLIRRYIVDIHVENISGSKSNMERIVIIETVNDAKNRLLADKMPELRSQYVKPNTFYVNSMSRTAYYDPEMTDEVPMLYIDRIQRRRVHTTINGKKTSIYPNGRRRNDNTNK